VSPTSLPPTATCHMASTAGTWPTILVGRSPTSPSSNAQFTKVPCGVKRGGVLHSAPLVAISASASKGATFLVENDRCGFCQH